MMHFEQLYNSLDNNERNSDFFLSYFPSLSIMENMMIFGGMQRSANYNGYSLKLGHKGYALFKKIK